MKKMDVKDTIVKQTRRIMPFDCNAYGFLFGGKLTAWLDELTSMSAIKFCRQPAVTASIDELHFIKSIGLDDIIYLESHVSGHGKRSIEVFAKVIGENIVTGEQYLASVSFWTFVIIDKNEQLLQDTLTTENLQSILHQYEERQNIGHLKRKNIKKIINQINTTLDERRYI